MRGETSITIVTLLLAFCFSIIIFYGNLLLTIIVGFFATGKMNGAIFFQALILTGISLGCVIFFVRSQIKEYKHSRVPSPQDIRKNYLDYNNPRVALQGLTKQQSFFTIQEAMQAINLDRLTTEALLHELILAKKIKPRVNHDDTIVYIVHNDCT